MSRMLAILLAGAIGLGFASLSQAQDWRHERWCDSRDHNCDGRIDRRDRDRDYHSPRRYDRAPSYEASGACTFQTPRGPVTGYKPQGKDRCCIETRNGPSCQ